jgi:exopolysaccharide biosynthesis polyprenyl glycosylphosphotransferase
VTLLGTIGDFSAVTKDQIVDEVFIALPIKSYYEEIQCIVKKAEEHGVIVRYPSDLFDAKVGRSRVEVLGHLPMLTITSGPREGWEYLAKQTIDKLLALLFLTLTFPAILLAATAIKLTSTGPILFVQRRVGKNKRIFRLYKFRTMVVSAEESREGLEAFNEMDGPVFKVRDDPRITKVGRWLRKWSIDELPQFFNVLTGDMSLVGPRPLPVRDFEGFGDDWRRRRFSVRPGITCSWQVNGRNGLSFEEWMKLDMEYIDNWKLSRDLVLLAQTIPAVLRGGGM